MNIRNELNESDLLKWIEPGFQLIKTALSAVV